MALNFGVQLSKGLLQQTNSIRSATASVACVFHTGAQCSRGSSKERPSTPTPRPDKDLINHSKVRGMDILRRPKINKGQAFTLKERQIMGIHGLIPPSIISQDLQVQRVMKNFHKRASDIDRYIYLMSLSERNERLFYRVLSEYTELMMPIVYTPTVGQACQQYGIIYRKSRGLFVTINDAGHVYETICNWPEREVLAVVVTDGERILGLGDLGCNGIGIPIGKLALYTALGGIPPQHCLPIVLDVGTNNQKLLDDPMYLGLRQPRVTGQEYDDFVDEFMHAIVTRYGQKVMIQFEDFANHNAFRFLEKYRNRYCMFNDDIQGTAAVAAAGIIAAMRITKTKLSDNDYVFQGAGEANTGIASLLVSGMEEEGVTREEALKKIWMVDSKGLIVKDRPKGGLTKHKEPFCKDHAPIDTLAEVVKAVKPLGLIGAAAIPGAFTEEMIRDMASFSKRPIIFALSNPTSKAECTAEQAYNWTEGRCIFASGSPFPPVEYNDLTYFPGQGNNAYIFPGVALAVTSCRIRHITDRVFLKAAQILAGMVTDDNLAQGRVYPPLEMVQEVSIKIATGLAQYAYAKGVAGTYPEPENKEDFIRSQTFTTDYECFEPPTWDWPEQKIVPH